MTKQRIVTGATILGCIGLLAGLILYFEKGSGTDVGVLRFLVVAMFTVLPASMYYLFISTRKSSLFQEYVTNLYRLGLLNNLTEHAKTAESFTVGLDGRYIFKMRLQSYILRFEGVYGPINESLSRELSAACQADEPITPTASAQAPERSKPVLQQPVFSSATALPVLLATFLIGVCWLILLPPWTDTLADADKSSIALQVLTHTGNAPLFAFLGAYFFSLQMLFRRFVTADLRARSYVSVSIRIVLAVIGAWALEALVVFLPFEIDDQTANLPTETSQALLVFAFIVGAFPPIIWRLLREATSKLTLASLAVPSMQSRLPASELDGLTVWHQTRLEEEDVENTYNMANVDIIDLLVNTKIPPERIIDWVDQAILYCVISQHNKVAYQDIKRELAQRGIRTATMLDEMLSKNKLTVSSEGTDAESIGIANVLLYQQAVGGFSNYQLVKNWRGNTYEPDNAGATA